MSKRPKRALIDMILNILEVAKEKDGVNKTRIIYRSNLNFNRAKDYIQMLLDLGLLSYVDNDSSRFATTTKGVEFMNRYRGVLALFGDDVAFDPGGNPWKAVRRKKTLKQIFQTDVKGYHSEGNGINGNGSNGKS